MTKPKRGADGKFTGSEGAGKSNPPRPPRETTAQRHRANMDRLRQLGGVIDPDYDGQYERLQRSSTRSTDPGRAARQRDNLDRLRQMGGVIEPVDDSYPPADTDLGNTGKHPVYGGLNWGVRYSEHWNDFSVNHGYYGSSEERDGKVYVDSSDVPLPSDAVRWTCDQDSETDAVTVWQHRDAVTLGLSDRGFSSQRGVRVRVEVGESDLKVSPFDRPTDFEPFTVPRSR